MPASSSASDCSSRTMSTSESSDPEEGQRIESVTNEDEMMLLDDEEVERVLLLEDHDVQTAPLFTRDAFEAAGYNAQNMQYGVMGRTLATCSKSSVEVPSDARIYLNTNAPLSALVWGPRHVSNAFNPVRHHSPVPSKGSGKSHTVSVMLENMLVPQCPEIGTLKKPLAGLVLHYGEGGRPCEAAWLGVPSRFPVAAPDVRVYVSGSSLNTMRKVYAPLGDYVYVEPLVFEESELDVQAFLSMMAVGSSQGAPLYMHSVLAILRELGESFSLQAFKSRLAVKKLEFNHDQLRGLEQRLGLMESFIREENPFQSKPEARFRRGQLTIIDLSDPFIDPASACALFEILTRLFVRAEVGKGKVLVVDEAHKYLSTSRASTGLTNSLLSMARQQRHLAMRVIISTQEPTVVPESIIDLCSVIFMHRFSSPSWWEHLIKHVSADLSSSDAFDRVVKLQTGQAIVLAPTALILTQALNTLDPDTAAGASDLSQLGRGYMVVKTRKRVTEDGGASILVLRHK